MSGEHGHADIDAQVAANLETINGVAASTAEDLAALDVRVAALEKTEPPPPLPGGGAAAGLWRLQQVATVGQVTSGSIKTALAMPEFTGLSARIPWNLQEPAQGNYDFSIAQAGVDLAKSYDKAFTWYFMAGQHTPNYVTAAGNTYQEEGVTVPCPWNPNGTPRQDYLDAYHSMVTAMKDFAVQNEVGFVHIPCFGAVWAEMNNGSGCRTSTGYGTNWTHAWLPAHVALVDTIVDALGDSGLLWAFSLTGRGPLTGGQASSVAEHLWTVAPDTSFIQYNGLDGSPPPRVGGATGATDAQWQQQMLDAPNRRGLQDIGLAVWSDPTQPGEAEAMFDIASLMRAEYVEVYGRESDPRIVDAAAVWLTTLDDT